MLRTGNKALAAATLLLDGCKGAAVVLIFARFGPGPETALISGFAAVLGHDFPVWLEVQGRQGSRDLPRRPARRLVAGRLGGVHGLAYGRRAHALFVLGALCALAAAPFFAHWLAGPPLIALAVPLALLGIARHHDNIRRLLKGDEPKMGRKGEDAGGI